MKIITFISIFLLCTVSIAFADDNEFDTLLSETVSRVVPPLISEFSSNLPEWAKRVDFSLSFEENFKPLWSFETIQPLYQSSETLRHTLFTQDRISHTSVDTTINIGFGYRFLSANEYWLAGINSFYDYTLKRRHERVGIGAEVMTGFSSLHANYYEALSSHRYYYEYGATVSEKALDGCDVEGQLQVPYLPWARASMKGYFWQGATKTSNNLEGYQMSCLAHITNVISLEFGRNNNSEIENNFLQLTCRLGAPKSVEYTLIDNLFSDTFFTTYDLKNKTLEKVRRHHDIVIEKRHFSAGATGGVFIGRGN